MESIHVQNVLVCLTKLTKKQGCRYVSTGCLKQEHSSSSDKQVLSKWAIMVQYKYPIIWNNYTSDIHQLLVPLFSK